MIFGTGSSVKLFVFLIANARDKKLMSEQRAMEKEYTVIITLNSKNLRFTWSDWIMRLFERVRNKSCFDCLLNAQSLALVGFRSSRK